MPKQPTTQLHHRIPEPLAEALADLSRDYALNSESEANAVAVFSFIEQRPDSAQVREWCALVRDPDLAEVLANLTPEGQRQPPPPSPGSRPALTAESEAEPEIEITVDPDTGAIRVAN